MRPKSTEEKRKPTSFRLSRQAQDILEKMTKATGLNKTDIIEVALREKDRREEAIKKLEAERTLF